jgi:hypothetical protein
MAEKEPSPKSCSSPDPTTTPANKPMSVIQCSRRYVQLVLNCQTKEAEALFDSQPNKIQLLLVKGFCDAMV